MSGVVLILVSIATVLMASVNGLTNQQRTDMFLFTGRCDSDVKLVGDTREMRAFMLACVTEDDPTRATESRMTSEFDDEMYRDEEKSKCCHYRYCFSDKFHYRKTKPIAGHSFQTFLKEKKSVEIGEMCALDAGVGKGLDKYNELVAQPQLDKCVKKFKDSSTGTGRNLTDDWNKCMDLGFLSYFGTEKAITSEADLNKGDYARQNWCCAVQVCHNDKVVFAEKEVRGFINKKESDAHYVCGPDFEVVKAGSKMVASWLVICVSVLVLVLG